MLLDKEVEDTGPHTFEWIMSETPIDLCSLPRKHPSHAFQVHKPCTLLSSQP